MSFVERAYAACIVAWWEALGNYACFSLFSNSFLLLTCQQKKDAERGQAAMISYKLLLLL